MLFPVLTPCCATIHASSEAPALIGHRIVPPQYRLLDDDRDISGIEREHRREAQGLLRGTFDAHVHLWPDKVLRALWRWFDAHAWEIAFRRSAEAALEALGDMGVARCASLVYAHRDGIAEGLNRYAAEMASANPMVTALGTVFPGETDADKIVKRAIDVHKLRGIKLHCHVQKMAIDHPSVMEILRVCEAMNVPAVVHCGREPASDAYGVNTHAICAAGRTERVLQQFSKLKLVVPHVGANEFDGYWKLVEQYEHLYLDTSMACAEYFAQSPLWSAVEAHADRVLYGTDFPIIPYEISRELRLIARRIVSDDAFEKIVRTNAQSLWPQ